MGGPATGIVAELGHTPTIYKRSTGELKGRGGGIVAQQNIRQFLTQSGDVEQSRPEAMVFMALNGALPSLRADSVTRTDQPA